MALPAFIAREAAVTAINRGLVVVLAKHPNEALTDLRLHTDDKYIKAVRKANGNEGIDFHSGGKIRIIRRADSGRGYSANLVIIPIGTSHDDMMNILPMLTTTGGDVVGYLAPVKEGATPPAETKADRVQTGRFTSHPAGWVDGRKTWRAAKAKRLAAIAEDPGAPATQG